MSAYNPLYVKGNSTGLVQSREEFILPNDAYPVLENAFVWRERIKRKQGYQLLGRLRRVFTNINFGEFNTGVTNSNLLDLTGYVSNITQQVSGVVTTTYPHNLVTGNQGILTCVVGMTNVNGHGFAITVLSPTTFKINIDTSLFPAYVSGGFFFSNRTLVAAGTEPNASIQPGSVVVTILATPNIVFTDQGDGTLTSPTPSNSGTINYATGAVQIVTNVGGITLTTATFSYYPALPVMGIRTRDLSPLNNEMTVFFDTKYAYNFAASGFVEFSPGTAWSSSLTQADSNFFWSTNYWISAGNIKIFWVTNDSGTSGDPIRYTNGTGNGSGMWIDFAPIIDASGNRLTQCLALLPFRGRLVAFNTIEGMNLSSSTSFSNRIRWAAIGNPFTETSSIVTSINANAWRDDIRGQGGFLDIPTNEDIITVGFVRDNLEIYCENSTWQLRYTGRSIAPFQIEKVNTELGAGSTFSAVQFDTSLVGIGDKGIVTCDSFQSNLIDIKIPDLVMNQINNNNFGQKRVHGIRDFFQRLAYWTYPDTSSQGTYPDRRLVYNYENDSWAIFTDSLTTLGTYQPTSGRTWANPTGSTAATKLEWQEANFPWVSQPSAILSIVGGNQQGYIEYLDEQTTNDASLTIVGITGNTTTATQITSPNHNMQTGAVISIDGIPVGTPFASTLNGNIFGVIVNTTNTFLLMKYNATTGKFSDPELDPPATYIGGGQISVRDNFRIVSKKFNFLEEGQNIQIGYIDVLMPTSVNGAITLNIYVDYDDNSSVNTLPENTDPDTGQPDTFFNATISTASQSGGVSDSSKTNQRVFCSVRGNYITLEYTLSNEQMQNQCQSNNVQIDMQIIWMRSAGRISNMQGA